MSWFKKRASKVEVEGLIKFNFEKNSNGDVVLSIYKQSLSNESHPYFLYDKFTVKRGDEVHLDWKIDISKEDLIEIINSLD